LTLGQLKYNFKEKTMKTIFITGASTGIGKAAAILFQKKGWNVAATMRNPAAANDLKDTGNIKCYQLDVTDSSSIAKSIKSAIEDFHRIDVLLNNAGIYTTGPFECASEKQIRQQIDTNIIGLFNVLKEFVPYFRERKAGTIINISSLAGKLTFPYQSLYHCTKWAIEGFSEGLQHELRNFNIKVKVVEPGMVKTDLYNHPELIFKDNRINYYNESIKKWYDYLLQNYAKGFGPEVSAKTIFKAANDSSFRLRYPSGSDTRMAFTLRRILPFSMFTWVIGKMTKIYY
jgi:NADP-dependent 3-hydroxy acid dehydrogenase YdfG